MRKCSRFLPPQEGQKFILAYSSIKLAKNHLLGDNVEARTYIPRYYYTSKTPNIFFTPTHNMSLMSFFEDAPEGATPQKPTSKVAQNVEDLRAKLVTFIENPLDQMRLTSGEDLQRTLNTLQVECSKMSENKVYDYNIKDYRGRLALPDSEIQEIFKQQILSHPVIGALYKKVLSLLPEDSKQEVFKKRLFDEYFQDLVYERINQSVFEESYSCDLGEFLYEPDSKEDGIQDYLNINLSCNLVGMRNEENLQKIFQYFQHVKCLDLGNNSLHALSSLAMETIFQNLRNVQYLDLSQNDLHKLSEKKLQIIFENLSNLKVLELRYCLGKMTKEKLSVIFKRASQLRILNLDKNRLNTFDEGALQSIFENVPHLKSISLRNSKLYMLDSTKLSIIFENLQHVRSIALTGDELEYLDEEQIKSIFSPLQKVKNIYMEHISDDFLKRISKVCPNLT